MQEDHIFLGQILDDRDMKMAKGTRDQKRQVLADAVSLHFLLEYSSWKRVSTWFTDRGTTIAETTLYNVTQKYPGLQTVISKILNKLGQWYVKRQGPCSNMLLSHLDRAPSCYI